MSRKSYRNRETKDPDRFEMADRVFGAQAVETVDAGQSPAKLMIWLWGVPIVLITLAVVLKVTGVS